MSNVSKSELSNEDIDRLMDEQNEHDAVNGGQEPDDRLEQDAAPERAERHDEPEQEKAKPIEMSPQDAKRQAMADRFRRKDDAPFDGDMTRAENLYGDVAAETLDVDDGLPEPGVPQGQQPQPRMITRTVRGKQVTKSEDEWLALAMKVDAADSYLEESQQLLKDAKAIRQERAGQSPQHPEGQTEAQSDGRDQDRRQDARHPGIDLTSVVEKIQYGDPAEAAAELARAIDTVATKQVNEGHVARLVSNDLARAKMDLKQFVEAHPDIATDQIASMVIENNVYQVYRDEIRALGVAEAQIPRDPKTLADWHRLYRVHGHTVSKTTDVLQKAKAKFDEWRGTPAQPKPAPRKDSARVEVNVNRTERRMAIPVQPSRSVAPRQNAAPVAQESSRKSAVQEMRRNRGQPVG